MLPWRLNRTKGCWVLAAVLFDLDGTLLDIDLDSFLTSYFRMLGPTIASIPGSTGTPAESLAAVVAGTEAMAESHPGRTNQEVFNETFTAMTGLDLSGADATRIIDDFYGSVFPGLRSTEAPALGAHTAVATAERLGVRLALATNPIFPRAAIAERARWAELDLGRFDLVTSYESMEACKPLANYYRQIAAELGVSPTHCLMVGDDPVLDLAAADVGMRTFFVGSASPVVADWIGTLEDLADLLPRLVRDGD